MFTDVYIPHYREYIESLIIQAEKILSKDNQSAIEYTEQYKTFSWWKKLWVCQPGDDDESIMNRFYRKRDISEYNQTLSRLSYEGCMGYTYTKVRHDSNFFDWYKYHENLGS